MKKYNLSGIVLGKLWGGGLAGYPSEKLEAETRKELIKKARKMLKDGSLDSGMGFESLKGALLEIKETEFVTMKGKEYQREEYSEEFIGKLTKKQKTFLRETFTNYSY